jgi:hypothetical protein
VRLDPLLLAISNLAQSRRISLLRISFGFRMADYVCANGRSHANADEHFRFNYCCTPSVRGRSCIGLLANPMPRMRLDSTRGPASPISISRGVFGCTNEGTLLGGTDSGRRTDLVVVPDVCFGVMRFAVWSMRSTEIAHWARCRQIEHWP